MNKIKLKKRKIHYNKPKDGYFAEINYMHGDADFYNSEIIYFRDKNEMIEHYFASSFDYDSHDWKGTSFSSIIDTLKKFGFNTIKEVFDRFSFFDEIEIEEGYLEEFENIKNNEIDNIEEIEPITALFNDFIQRDDFELVRADKSCDGWHAAKVQGVEYYQMKNGEKYEIEFKIKEEE